MLPCWYPGARLFWLCDCCFLERILAVFILVFTVVGVKDPGLYVYGIKYTGNKNYDFT